MLKLCGEAEDKLAQELIHFELQVERDVIEPLFLLAEVSRAHEAAPLGDTVLQQELSLPVLLVRIPHIAPAPSAPDTPLCWLPSGDGSLAGTRSPSPRGSARFTHPAPNPSPVFQEMNSSPSSVGPPTPYVYVDPFSLISSDFIFYFSSSIVHILRPAHCRSTVR